MSNSTHPSAQTNNRGRPERQRIDFAAVRRRFSLLDELRQAGVKLYREGSTYKGCCHLHDDKTASLVVYLSNMTYYCFGCAAFGDVTNVRMFNDPSLKNAVAAVESLLGSDVSPELLTSAPLPDRADIAGVVFDPSKIVPVRLDFVLKSMARLRDADGLDEARELARRRGWMPEQLAGGQYPAAVGASWAFGPASRINCPRFFKRVRRRQSAVALGIERQFDEAGGDLVIDSKYRLTPSAEAAWRAENVRKGRPQAKVPKWLARRGYASAVPWEFTDGTAPVVVITEGPGDGARLYHEAFATDEAAGKYGSRWHIVSVDAATTLHSLSLPRKVVQKEGGGQEAVGFFDGFTHAFLLLDRDEAGRKGASVAVEKLREQYPKLKVRDVLIPTAEEHRAGGASAGELKKYDLSDFFEAGGTIDLLAGLMRNTAAAG